MKLTVATATIVSSISASAESLQHPAGKSSFDAAEGTTRARHRSLADAIESQRQITSKFEGRRGLKNRKGRIARNMKDRLKLQSSELRNQAEDGNMFATEDELDLGFFSRKLQTNATAVQEDEKNRFDVLLDFCENGRPEDGFYCTCTGADEDQYSISLVCSYAENSCSSEVNVCGDYEDWCYSETFKQELTAPETGYSKQCIDVLTPIKQSYCFTIMYDTEESNTNVSCSIEFDGAQCNSCTYDEDQCAIFDCTNIDNGVGAGSLCDYSDSTIWAEPVYDALYYGRLPCEGGCNICPEGEKMTDIYNTVEYYGTVYYCWELVLGGLMGEFKDQPGDLCSSLTPLVEDACGCKTPVEQILVGADEGVTIVNSPADEGVTIVNSPADDVGGGSSTSSATISSFISGFAITAAANSIFSWMMA